MFIPDPDFCPSWISDPGSRIPDLGSRISDPGSRIPDPKTATKERGEKICCHTFTQKIVTMLSKIWVWDPGSGKNLFRIPDPGVKKAPDPGSGSATLISAAITGWLLLAVQL